MKAGVIFGLIGAACAVINSLLWIIRTFVVWEMEVSGNAGLIRLLQYIGNIQTFVLYPITSVCLFTFFVMFLINIKKTPNK